MHDRQVCAWGEPLSDLEPRRPGRAVYEHSNCHWDLCIKAICLTNKLRQFYLAGDGNSEGAGVAAKAGVQPALEFAGIACGRGAPWISTSSGRTFSIRSPITISTSMAGLAVPASGTSFWSKSP